MKGDEERPAVEPAQDGDGERVLAEREIAADGDGDEPDDRRRQADDDDGEQDVLAVEREGLVEIAQPVAAFDLEGTDDRGGERHDEKQRDRRQRRQDEDEAEEAFRHGVVRLCREHRSGTVPAPSPVWGTEGEGSCSRVANPTPTLQYAEGRIGARRSAGRHKLPLSS
jgi:hypothetical protein